MAAYQPRPANSGPCSSFERGDYYVRPDRTGYHVATKRAIVEVLADRIVVDAPGGGAVMWSP